jgi:hypothetical protein
MGQVSWSVEFPLLFIYQLDIDTPISAISDLQNQTVTVPQQVGFFERRRGKPI